jgi:hypothetical protein
VDGTHFDVDGRRIDRFALFEHRNDDRWNVVIFLWAGLAPLVEVEAFIKQCDATEDIPLGYGILYDQYDRFPEEVKRRLILRLFQLNLKLQEGNHCWLCSGPIPPDGKSKTDLHIPNIELRTLQSIGGELLNLLRKAASDSLLLWSDTAKEAHGKMRRLIWMSVASSGINIRDWSLCISQLPVKMNPPAPERWLFWLTGNIVYRHIRANENSSPYIQSFFKVYPDRRRDFVVAILDILPIPDLFKEKPHSDNEKRSLVNLLLQSEWESVSAKLLLATYEWDDGFQQPDSRGFDLLDNSLDELKSWRGNPQLNGDQLEQVISKVSQLITRRDKLTEEQPHQSVDSITA